MNQPDAWVIVKISSKLGSHYRVLAGWYGGYMGSDHWQLNSGITKVEDNGDFYDFYGESGSVYRCHKNAERFTGLTQSIFNSMQTKLKELETGSLEYIPFEKDIQWLK